VFKFDRRHDQVLPSRFLDFFRGHINYVSRLVCVGYSFGDVHINQVVREWLEFSAQRRLEIVNPSVEQVPTFLLHLVPQVTLTKSTFSDYLDALSGVQRSSLDVLEKRFAAWARRRTAATDRAVARKEFEEFLVQYQEKWIRAFAQQMASLPVRDGDIDLQALGLTAGEAAQRVAQEVGGNTPDDLLEKFLETRASP
jgi:hypothetical protein